MSGIGGSNEGASSVRPPLLTGINYSQWKGKMEAYVCQIHDRAWMAIEDGYSPPMMTPTGGGEEVLKPKAQWSPEEFETSKWNRKAWHALLCAVDENQYKLIQNTKIAKEAWDILEVAHEGTEVVKDSKLQVLQTQFETLKMEENECFNDFEIRLMDIVNQSHQLGDPYSDRRIKQKIMRSLPERFESKVTALEENSDFKNMKPSEVIGRLLAYESRKVPSSSPPKKQKGIALRASKVGKEEKGDLDEDMILMLQRFKKFVKFEKRGFGSKGQDLKKKAPFKKHEHRQEKGVQCYECGGIGHISLDCGNLKNKREKMMVATWSESDDSGEGDKSSSDDELINNFKALGATNEVNEVVGKIFVASDPIEEKVEEVALEEIVVASHWDMALIDSRDQGEGLDEDIGSIGEEESLEDDTSGDDSLSNSTNANVENMDVHDFIVNVESSMKKKDRLLRILEEENLELSTYNDHLRKQVEKMDLKDNFESFESFKLKNEKEIQRLKEELLRLSTQVDDLNDEVIRSMVEEDKLKDELALSKRNEEGLKRELVEAKESLTRMTTSTKKLDNILGVGKSPCDKRGLGFEVSKDCSIPKKTVFVKSLGKIEASPVQTPRKKLELGQCSKNAQVKVVKTRQPQAQRFSASRVNSPQQMTHYVKRQNMLPHPRRQPIPVQPHRRHEPTQHQRRHQMHDESPMTSHEYGMNSYFVPTCHYCGVYGHIRPKCFKYIKHCRINSMIEKKRLRRAHLHEPRISFVNNPRLVNDMQPLTTKKKKVISMWIRKNEPACYETNKSQIGSSKSNGLGRSIGPHDLH
ncbi:hypothetical protein Q3G72_020129 [Acer saccharum]|nr:hypothetical protein Q3G72_020129 [Acer saccharum]